MHSLLEDYLSEVDVQLSALPVKQRTEELREMRQHLLNAVTVNRELGQSEEDAATNAVLQFGTPQDLGSNLVWAWRREETRNKGLMMQKCIRSSFCAGATSVVLLGSLLCFIGNPTSMDAWGHKFGTHSYLCLFSHSYPSAFRVDHAKGEVGITFGRCMYIY